MNVRKLHQVVALIKGAQERHNKAINLLHHQTQRSELYTGLSRVYQRKDDDGDQFPPESQLVQRQAEDDLKAIAGHVTALLNLTGTKDYANMGATASVVVDGNVLIAEAPVPFLLFYQKQLEDFRTIVTKTVILDPTVQWTRDDNAGFWRSNTTQTTKTRKVPKVLVKYDATDKHPAQTETYMVDEVIGTWEKTDFSGALAGDRKAQLLDRINKVIDAVKVAVEEANQVEAPELNLGEATFAYLLS